MGTPKQPRGTKPFRQWDEEENLSVAMTRDLDSQPPTVSNKYCGEIARIWPIAAVDTLLTAWGYDCEPPENWIEIDAVLWHHIDNLFSLFTQVERGGPWPFKTEAQYALQEYDRGNRNTPTWRDAERSRLFDEQEREMLDNSRWLAEYTMRWLDAGLRLLEVTGGQR